jgi:hypothetical protein
MVQALASRLVLLGPNGVPERPFAMEHPRLVLGRSGDSDVVLTEPQVSRHHAEIRNDHGRWVLRDLGSTHGTTRNGDRIDRPVVLHHGDVIGLGPTYLRFEESSAEPPTMVRPVPWSETPPRPPVPRSGIEIDDQYAGSINNVEGVQNNYVQQVLHERQSFLREVAATRTRARFFIWLGVLVMVAGIVTMLVVFGELFGGINDAFRSPEAGVPESPFGRELGGVPVVLIGGGAEVLGLLMIIIGVVLHVVATARRRDVDRRLPDPRIPRHR